MREHHSRTRKARKTNFGKKQGPCTSNQCYGAAFGVFKLIVNKYEKNYTEITS